LTRAAPFDISYDTPSEGDSQSPVLSEDTAQSTDTTINPQTLKEAVGTGGYDSQKGPYEDAMDYAMPVTTMKTLQDAEYVRRRATTGLSQLQQIKDRAQSQTTLVSLGSH